MVVKGGGACQGYLHVLRNTLLEIVGFGEPSRGLLPKLRSQSLRLSSQRGLVWQ